MHGQEAVYLFEAKGIQRYLSDSSKLKDVIGASEIIFQMARADGQDLLGEVLEALEFTDKVKFSRRASAAFMMIADKETLLEFRTVWRLVIQLSAPGLEFSDEFQAVDKTLLDAMEACYQAGSGLRDNGLVSVLPLANPFNEFVHRTGRARVASRAEDSEDTLDQIIKPQYKAFTALKGADHDGVASRFLPDDVIGKEPYIFPRNMEESDPDKEDNPLFPFLPNNSYVALIHADISGLGEVWQNISKAFENNGTIEDLADISRKIEESIAHAAQIATRKVLLKEADYEREYDKHVLPARPLVLGGDDLTIIVRADLAMSYTAILLEEIETKTTKAFEELRKKIKWLPNSLPDYLSACAGVAYMKVSQPIAMANELAEGLCKYAKSFAKKNEVAPYPSGISFHVIRTSLQENYKDILDQDLTLDDGRLLVSHPVYLGKKARGPEFKHFEKLVVFLRDNRKGIGKLKSLKSELAGSQEVAKKIWLRWRDVFKQSTSKQKMDEFDNLLIALGVEKPKELPFDNSNKTPLFDAITLADLDYVSEGEVGTRLRRKAAA